VEALATLKWQDSRHSLIGANIPLHDYITAHWRQHLCQLSTAQWPSGQAPIMS